MNLRWFHAVLILLSALLAVVFGIYCLTRYGHNGVGGVLGAIVAFALSFGLIAYDSWFLRKTRTLR
jgi:hypothetical protein